MDKQKRRGPKLMEPGQRRIMIRFSIKQSIIDEIGGEDNKDLLLKPEIVEANKRT